MTKFKPILFSTPMVEAVMNGTKTQTRRLVKEQIALEWIDAGFTKEYIAAPENNMAKYQIGDVLWVRETWQITDFLHPSDENYGYIYKASENGRDWEQNSEEWKWKPSIFIPKEACRNFLEVTNVRLERLHDISTQDIYAEGIRIPVGAGDKPKFDISSKHSAFSFIKEFTEDGIALAYWAELWTKINGIESWNANPYVWAYTFKVIAKPKDFMV